MRSWSLLLISALAATPAALALALPPSQIEIAFEMTRNDLAMAETVERLQHANGRYELVETWTGNGAYFWMGTIKRTSRGLISEHGLQPIEFSDERTGRPPARAWFDWTARTLAMEYRDPRRVEPLPPDAQDRLSFLLALSFLPGRSEVMRFAVFDGRGQTRQEYRVRGRERLKLPAGEFDTVVVDRVGGNDAARLWLARELGHLPVRLLVTQQDGTRLEQTAVRITRP